LRKTSLVLCIGISLCILSASGCARKTTTADLMKGHAVELQSQVDLKNQLAKDWERGQKLITSGEKRIKAGEKRVKAAERDLKKGQDDIDRGKREIAEGQKLIEESEKRFQENFPELQIK
jgi:peptidoglycan hydrolase CwlO-like protein